jgi:hypothetical protein
MGRLRELEREIRRWELRAFFCGAALGFETALVIDPTRPSWVRWGLFFLALGTAVLLIMASRVRLAHTRAYLQLLTALLDRLLRSRQ